MMNDDGTTSKMTVIQDFMHVSCWNVLHTFHIVNLVIYKVTLVLTPWKRSKGSNAIFSIFNN